MNVFLLYPMGPLSFQDNSDGLVRVLLIRSRDSNRRAFKLSVARLLRNAA